MTGSYTIGHNRVEKGSLQSYCVVFEWGYFSMEEVLRTHNSRYPSERVVIILVSKPT